MNCGLTALPIILLAVYVAAGLGVLEDHRKWSKDELYPADDVKLDGLNSLKYEFEARHYEEYSELEANHRFKVVDGDVMIAVKDPTDDEKAGNEEGREKRNALRLPDSLGRTLWPNGIIPYVIVNYFACEERIILQAMQHWEDKTCIRFRRRISSDQYFVNIISATDAPRLCASTIGRQSISEQPQRIYLGRDCLTFATAAHELGHTIGFYHEHNRADRDDHVTVHESNIVPDNFTLDQFDIDDGNTLGLGYDFASIMHYSRLARSRNGNETITANKPNIFLSGTSDGIQELSPLDILKANTLYSCSCPLPAPTTTVPRSCIVLVPPDVNLNCSRVYTLGPGAWVVVTSPNYPTPTPDQTCVGILQCPIGYQVHIEFPNGLQLDQSSDCSRNYISLYKGSGLASRNLLRVRFGQSFTTRICSLPESSIGTNFQELTVLYNTTDSNALEALVICVDQDECVVGDHRCHNCKNSVGRFECECNQGYYYSNASRTCYDINECAYQNGGCQDRCVNLGGSYHCECSSGFLQADGKSCGSSRPSSTSRPTAPTLPETCSVLCPALSNPADGLVFTRSRAINDISFYFCNPGFRMVGSFVRLCLPDRTWSGSEPTCEREWLCPTLQLSNGSISYTSRSPGGRATVSCDPGYALIDNNNQFTCQTFRTFVYWNPVGIVPKCQPATQFCPTLSQPANGEVFVSSTAIGSVATYSCNRGYTLSGSSTRTCESRSPGFAIWIPSNAPTCLEQTQCTLLPNPVNGRVIVLSTSVGGIATYLCNSGYSLVGFSRRTCQSGGTWSGSAPTCQSRPCPTLSNPSNGRVAVSSSSVGGTATYSCNSGYNLVGSSRRTCQSGGTWSGSAPSCQSQPCPTLSNPANGRVVVSSTSVGGIATYLCNSGYSLVGSSRRTCQSGGTWSGSAPSCQSRSCPTLSNPNNGRVAVFSTSVGGTATYSCNSGYNLVGSSRRTCQSGGTWSGSAPTCQSQPCPTLSNHANGRVVVSSTSVGGTATYLCNSGYNLLGSSTRTCQSGGTWSGSAPTCQSRSCPTLSNPNNGRVVVSTTSVGGTATYSCNSGYNLVGSSRHTCQSGGTWSGSAPTCQSQPCPTLSNHANGRVVVSSTSVGGTATYLCNSGYNLLGSSTRTCQSGGTWSGSAPTCQSRSCPTLSNPNNGRVVVSTTSVGGTATYSCNSGYNLVGSSRHTCQSGGTWSGSAPTCQSQPCPTLSNHANGRVVVSSTSVGGTATYLCNSGYNLLGSSTRTCQSGGTWSGSAPTCQSRSCLILSNPNNGRVAVSSTSVGGTATYSCNSGYNLVGSSRRTCQSGGTWSGSAPLCRATSTAVFFLRGQMYPNGSSISLPSIGQGDSAALIFRTSNPNCCRTQRLGECYYPDGALVRVRAGREQLYRNRGEQLIRLNRQTSFRGRRATTGLYCCNVPDWENICVTIIA